MLASAMLARKSLALAGLLFCSAAAQGNDPRTSQPEALSLELDAGGAGSSWSVAVNKGPPEFRVLRSDGEEILEMKSARSSFGFQRKLKVDLARYPVISWRWRADVLPEGGDFRSARTDDQAASLYVAFSASRAIGYVWDSSAPAGSTGDCVLSPPFMKVKIMVLRSGPDEAGRWALERRDLRSDYRLLFGEEMPESKEVGLRIWINSQHTGTKAASAFADVSFTR